MRIVASLAAGEKCERCWQRQESVGYFRDHPALCGRCVMNVREGIRTGVWDADVFRDKDTIDEQIALVIEYANRHPLEQMAIDNKEA